MGAARYDENPARSLRGVAGVVEGSLANIEGCDCYRIDGVDQMEPFLVSVVSSSDLWMFASSRGPLTAGRTDADRAFLPYETDDRIHRAVHITGPVTIVTRDVDGVREVWRPFGPAEMAEGRRSLAKSVIGDRLIFEETHTGWGVTYRATWMPSPSFGWVRRVQLIDDGGSGSTLEVVDGLLDVMPPAVEAGLEQMRSNLVDAYKRSETGRWGTAAIYTLESLISDRAEPGEALSANVIWSQGAPDFEVHLDERVLDAAVGGRAFPPSELLTGRRGAYLLRGPVELPPGGSVDWTIVADVDLSHAEIVDRLRAVGSNETLGQLESDIRSGSQRLGELLAASDAMQDTGDPIADAHHLSNVLFNVMRGGLFPHESQIPMADYLRHLESWNSPVHERHAQALGRLGDSADATELGSIVEASADDHLTRLTLEYLPLAFSRRHGDPSRPWNRFSINVRGDDGEDLLGYEGNWRDIFQNWEALLVSHPQFVANVVAKFVNASTIDGHNPYRITHTGVDWEVPDPHDPWANIGYWGDHQIVYLHRLVDLWQRSFPGQIGSWLDRRAFVYADVPYVIADRQQMVEDPRNTIAFDGDREARVHERVEEIGADGRLVVDGEGRIATVGLLEKLLVPVLAKLTSLVPGGGIWMNTQRPEWNDANNALAGFGVSMVTLYHLLGYVTWLQDLVTSEIPEGATLSNSVARWAADITRVLEHYGETCHTDDSLRRQMMDDLGAVGDGFRASASTRFDPTDVEVSTADLARLLTAALDHLRCAIDESRRPDGLVDSYNVVAFPSGSTAVVSRLGPMLEGQVAAL